MVAAPPLPITLLSGFLGAGKTTTLQKILKNKEGIKCAVIVNDIAAVNVDADIVSKDVKGEDSLIRLENGCVCCSLNDRLVSNIVALARSREVDYLLVENSGVAHPQNIADPLSDPVAVLNDQKHLTELVKIDTCATVLDVSTFFKYLNDGKRVKGSTHGDHEGHEQRAESDALICQLLVGQIEYADVVALNKTDLLPANELQEVFKAVQALNPQAEVVMCSHGAVDLQKLLGTSKFSRAKFSGKPTVSGSSKQSHANLQDAVSSFVYTSRMPFHPERLHAFLSKHFDLREQDSSADMQQHQQDALETIHHASRAIATAARILPKQHAAVRQAAEAVVAAAKAAACAAEAAAEEHGGPASASAEQDKPELAMDSVAEVAQVRLSSDSPPLGHSRVFGQLLRSKGQVWIAGAAKHDHLGQWSMAGNILELSSGGPWAATLPLKLWPEDEAKRKEMLADFAPGIGDRKQELVFIGIGLAERKLREALNGCLCTTWEWLEVQQGQAELADHFQCWPALDALLPDDSEDEEGEDEEMAMTTEMDQLVEIGA